MILPRTPDTMISWKPWNEGLGSLDGLGEVYDYGGWPGTPFRGNPNATIPDSISQTIWWSPNVAGYPVTEAVLTKARELGIIHGMSPNLDAFYSSAENLQAAAQYSQALTRYMQSLGAPKFRCAATGGPFYSQFCYADEIGPIDGQELTINPYLRDIIANSSGHYAGGGILPLPSEVGVNIPGVPVYTTPNPFPNAGTPQQQSTQWGTLLFKNLTSGNTLTPRVGDQWELRIHSAPANAKVSVHGGKDGVLVTSQMGTIKPDGTFVLTDTFKAGDIGRWSEKWMVDGYEVGSFSFILGNVGSNAPAAPGSGITPSGGGGNLGTPAGGGFFDEELIAGVDNKWLLLGGAGFIALLVIGGRR